VLLCELGVACYFMTMSLMTNAILPANGNEKLPLVAIVLGGLTKIVVTYVLVGNPSVNIYGAPLGTISCYVVMLAVNLYFMGKKMARPIRMGRVVARPALSAALMGVAAWAVWSLLHGLMSGVTGSVAGRDLNVLVPFAAAVLTGVVVYFVMIIALRAITWEDMMLFPKGEKIAKILHIHSETEKNP
jgi:stage V sporulation protein B